MIRRQEKEGGNRGGSSRELLRSLPAEQQEDKGRGGRGDIAPGLSPLMAEEFPQSYQDLLREASQRAVPDREQSLER